MPFIFSSDFNYNPSKRKSDQDSNKLPGISETYSFFSSSYCFAKSSQTKIELLHWTEFGYGSMDFQFCTIEKWYFIYILVFFPFSLSITLPFSINSPQNVSSREWMRRLTCFRATMYFTFGISCKIYIRKRHNK